ncbi:hypothetical protein K1719_016591 [Acacia pycnantha]|nr:hypothetical protein K1719_016591 [Acacia pycnantha]
MKLSSYYILLLLSVLSQSLHCCCQSDHQCPLNDTKKLGHNCNSLQKSCTSFVTFRSNPPYNTTLSIANLLGSEESSIASLNNIPINTKHIPSNQVVIVPIDCSCLGGIYQHVISYTVERGDNFSAVANSTYQGLAICQMLIRQYYAGSADYVRLGDDISVPVLCACPAADQISDGVSSLLVHSISFGESPNLIAQAYGVNLQTLLTTNQLSSNTTLYPFTTLLVPLKPSSCKLNPHLFNCTCSFSQKYLPNSSFNTLDCDHIQTDPHRFPVKLVASLGVGVGVGLLSFFLLGHKLYQYLRQKQERVLPNDRTHLTTVVQGTFGYIDPEYFQSSQFTNKSDVYSFGVVLIELISGRKPITFSDEDQGRNLVAEFIALMKGDRVFEILDARVVREGRKDDILSVVNLAKRCVRLNGKKRPTMQEVSAELEGLRKTQNSLEINDCSLEFPHMCVTPSESDQESTEESVSSIFQTDSMPI